MKSILLDIIKRPFVCLPGESYWLTRDVYIRFLGLIYFTAFAILWNQFIPLLGQNGLLPVPRFLELAGQYYQADAIWNNLSIFWISYSDNFALALIALSLLTSFIMMLGRCNGISLLILWIIYSSFTNVGQIFYSYGWDIMLCEIGFISIFLVPFFSTDLYKADSPPPKLIIVLFSWMLFRIMFGAGMIKIRGDQCWRDLTCMSIHYQTQPNPHPLSYFFHVTPMWFHKFETLFNHFVELVVPFFLFFPRYGRPMAGIFFIIFQALLILSGNLAFLNWLTILIAIPCFSDKFIKKIIPRRLAFKFECRQHYQYKLKKITWFATIAYTAVVVYLSIPIFNNLFLSKRQAMNASFDKFHLVNTYGAFGSITKKRYEIIVSGSRDGKTWQEYDFKCKPGPVDELPCLITPYHYRLDWQMWFAAFKPRIGDDWLIHLAYKLLTGQKDTLTLIERNPFGDKPPLYIKMDYYDYVFSNESGKIWERTFVSPYMPAMTRDSLPLTQFLRANKFLP